jgi:hypothetical protein
LCLAGTIQTGACVLNILGNIVVYFTLFGFFLGEYFAKVNKCNVNISTLVSIILAFQEDHGWQI